MTTMSGRRAGFVASVRTNWSWRTSAAALLIAVAACKSDDVERARGSDTTASPNRYTTTLPLAEDPISEGGRWINGGTVGLDWTNVATSPGLATGRQGDV